MSAIAPDKVMSRVSRISARLPRLSRATGMSRGEVAIWLLSAALIALGIAVLRSGELNYPPIVPSMRVSFWILLVAFACAERFVVHVHFRRSAHSMSLGEIPLVFALVFAGGHDVILAGALGRLLVLAVHRRLPPIRLAFNFGQFLVGNCVAVLVFHAVAGASSQIDPTVWAAAALATAASSLCAVLLISAAVSLSDGMLSTRQVAASLSTDLAVAAVNTSIGLCAATVVYNDWRAAILMAVPVVGVFLTFQAYIKERQRHGRLEFLYEAARTLTRTPEVGTALEGLLGQALDAFRAEVAEIIFFSPDGSDALRTTVRANGAGGKLEGLEPAIVADLSALITSQEPGAFATRAICAGPLADYLEQRQLGRGMFAVLSGESNCMGAMIIGNPSGVVDRFSADDVKLFETLANNTSVALENDRLGNTVWRMKELQRELEHQASHDPLTDLANRLLFAERVSHALERAPESVSVIFIDINDFKTINDTLGHAAGDELLIAIGRRLRDCVRPSDTLARLGGDEFAIMLDRTGSQDEAIQVAERINRQLADRFSIAGQHISVRASAGIATGAAAAGGAISHEELIRNADVAMYRAKQASKRGWELFESGMEVPVMRRHGLKQRLREAVREDSFQVHYQPIVELETGRVSASEALVRWLDGPRGCVNPGSFIPIAEEMGVIVPLGRSILERACREAQRWPSDGQSAPLVHVNLSPVELRDPHFLTGVAGVLERSGLRPDRLVLEITEGVVLRDPEKSIAILNELRGLGVQLALDDFGTGYSSLSHLRALPIDWLKIGKPFVDEGGLDRPFLRMILELAADLNLGVVAEGIESRGQLGSLRDLGCGFGQGFYLGSPAELESAGHAPRLNDIADFRVPALTI